MKEEEIRPEKLFNELLRLNREDIGIYFKKSKYTLIKCPACEAEGVFTFHKDGFNFDECPNCKTLYVSPRPDKESFNNYYTNSNSTKFWATTFYKATEKNRRKMLWKPKAKMVLDKINKFLPSTEKVIDIGGGYGIFIEEFLKIDTKKHLVIEPSEYLSKICEQKSLKVLPKFLEDIKPSELPDCIKTFVSFELFEHLHNPKEFLETLYKIMKSNDIFIFTTLSGMGVDIQVLKENSKAVSPPMHLNFFNPKSINVLLKKVGFETLEITTPGKIDIDILKNNIDYIQDKFWKNFIEYSDDQEKQDMQQFIASNRLSSHMMIVCQKI